MTRLFIAPKALQPPRKNIVLCLDGTGNQFEACNSNVVRLFQTCVRDRGQIAFYDPGVGTRGDAGYKTSFGRAVDKALGNAFGAGLMRNVEEAYSYLMEHHEDGDRIFIFGFSRGAYTARVLAGFINRCGLLEKGCQNLIPYAMDAFVEQLDAEADREQTRDHHRLRSSFRRTFGRRFGHRGATPSLQAPIHFLGLWDTVKSYGWLYDPIRIPRESTNESVGIVRHAIALDERRVFFPPLHWRRKGKPSPGHTAQDVREVWFAGVHGDVGGTPRDIDAGLSKIALDWMLAHAVEAGLRLDADDYLRVVHALPAFTDGTASTIAAPDAAARRHESLAGAWRLLQALPWRGPVDDRLHWLRPRRDSERMRAVPASAVIHASTLERMGLAAECYEGRARAAPYRPGQLAFLTPELRQDLADGKPVRAAAPGPPRMMLPLPDRSGECLLHTLSAAERQAPWPQGGPATGLQALCLLAQATTRALHERYPAGELARQVSFAIDEAAEVPRFAARQPAARWLAALTAPAGTAAAALADAATRPVAAAGVADGNWPASIDPAAATHETALQACCAQLMKPLKHAHSIVDWMKAFERAGSGPGGTAPANPGWQVARQPVDGVGHGDGDRDVEARIDALLGALERAVEAWIGLLPAPGKPAAPALPAAALAAQRLAQCRAVRALDGGVAAATPDSLADAFERVHGAWTALTGPAAGAAARPPALPVPAALALATPAAVAGDDAWRSAAMAPQLHTLRKCVAALMACDSGRYLAMTQALQPDAAVVRLCDRLEAVDGLIDSRREFALAAGLLDPSGAVPTLGALRTAIENLDGFPLRWRLSAGQREALVTTRGALLDSLVTWADRLHWAEQATAAGAPRAIAAAA